MGKYIILAGLFILMVGVAVFLVEKAGMKRMPLDLSFQKGNVSFFFPLGTSLLVSIILTVILNLFFRK